MKTKSPPSRYRYCISRLSTLAMSTLMPALKVLSTTLPDITFLSLVRTKAGPLPGFTCWNSTTFQSCPSRFSVMPFFRSFVLATDRLPFITDQQHLLVLQDQQFPGGRSEGSGPVARRHDQHVLDPDAAQSGQVHTRLDGDRNPIAQLTRSSVPEHRRLVDLEAHAVPEAVLEMPGMPGRLDQVPRGGVNRPGLDPVAERRDAGLLRQRDQLVDVALPVGHRADRHRAGHVRVVAVVERAEVHRHQIAHGQLAVGRDVMRDGPVGATGDDGVERGAVGTEQSHL